MEDISTDELTLEEYAALWGCDPCYDRAPRQHGDGYLFYNFAVEGNDPAFLRKFLPAIGRTLRDKTLQGNDVERLEELRNEVYDRLARLSKMEA